MPHQCQETGALEFAGGRTFQLPTGQGARTAPYLNAGRGFARNPPNADVPRRDEDMPLQDRVHRDNAQESLARAPGFHTVSAR